MCGFVGYIQSGSTEGQLKATVTAMADQLIHRGPDDSGVWVDAAQGIGLGHRRLSIIDLSIEGHQPMTSASNRYVIIFNGEIYNYKEIAARLSEKAHKFRGHSDTEVVLASIEEYGLEASLKSFVGMFAFALWDKQEKRLILARDRAGEKPLYYGFCNRVFFFGSELKSFKAHPKFNPKINRQALQLFMQFAEVPSPHSIYEGIHKLEAGTFAVLNQQSFEIQGVPYWSATEVAESGLKNLTQTSDKEAVDELERLIRQSVSQQMISDVPLGAFLSGGVDSSTVVALMQTQSNRPVKTFSIGFEEKAFDESAYARDVAKHLKTDHTELILSQREAQSLVPRLPEIYDEPFADSSQIPTFFVAQLARKHVTVSLSGDAGDELFGGYNRYTWGRRIYSKMKLMPQWSRELLVRALRSRSPEAWDQSMSHLSRISPKLFHHRQAGLKIQKLSEILLCSSPQMIYQNLVSHWPESSPIVVGGEPEGMGSQKSKNSLPDIENEMMLADFLSYLPDDILVKVDRASMAVSLESRVPLLDHRIIEFAWRLPLQMKIRNGVSKWILREVLYRHVPKHLIDRPKMGFGIPLQSWLRGDLRSWVESLLTKKRIEEDGYFHWAPIERKWKEHLAGTSDWSYHLWDVLMFQSWLEKEQKSKNETPIRHLA